MLANHQKIISLITDAGGEIIGRTRLQKVAYLLHAAGFENTFTFSYRHYGPYSEGLTVATAEAVARGAVQEVEQSTSWGGSYFVYRANPASCEDKSRAAFAVLSAKANAIALELAATAVFLNSEKVKDAWAETIRRKPEKATTERIADAKKLLRELSELRSPKQLAYFD